MRAVSAAAGVVVHEPAAPHTSRATGPAGAANVPSAPERRAAQCGRSEGADRVVAAAGDMAERFRQGATLYSLGDGMATSDAQHVAVTRSLWASAPWPHDAISKIMPNLPPG